VSLGRRKGKKRRTLPGGSAPKGPKPKEGAKLWRLHSTVTIWQKKKGIVGGKVKSSGTALRRPKK